MKRFQIPATIISILLLLPSFSYSEPCNGFRDPSVLNLLQYNVDLRSDFSPQKRLVSIEKGKRQTCLGNYKHFYIERHSNGADPWEFNLCDLQISYDQTTLFVLTEEGLFILDGMNSRDVLQFDLDVLKQKAKKRLLPLD